MINLCLEPQVYYNDWQDYRDGFRGCDDRKQIRNQYTRWAEYLDVKKWNSRLKKLILRRKAKQGKQKGKN